MNSGRLVGHQGPAVSVSHRCWIANVLYRHSLQRIQPRLLDWVPFPLTAIEIRDRNKSEAQQVAAEKSQTPQTETAFEKKKSVYGGGGVNTGIANSQRKSLSVRRGRGGRLGK